MKTSFITKATLLVSVFALFALGSCEDFSPSIKVPFSSEAEFNLEQSRKKSALEESNVELLHEWNFEEDLNKIISDYGGDPEKIKESNVKTVTLTITGESEVELDAIISYLELKIDKIPAENKELVAHSKDITATSITFELIKADIFDYVTGSNGFTFYLYGTVNNQEIPYEGLGLTISIDAEVVVELF